MLTKETTDKILKFRDDRDFKKYHNGKDLAISISLEASELLEIFQWSAEDTNRLDRISKMKEELADILMYSVMFADYYDIDFNEIIEEKLVKNLEKYPLNKKINLKEK